MATINLIETEEKLLLLKEEWDALVAANPMARVFQTFDWNIAMWSIYHRRMTPGGRLYVINAVREGHDEKAIFPFWLDNKGVLRFISSAYSDMCDAVYAQHTGNWDNFYCDVAKFILDDKRVKSLALSKLVEGSEILDYFGVCFPDVEIKRQFPFSYLPVAKSDNISDALGHLTSKERSYIRSLLKKHPEFDFKIFSKSTGDAFPRAGIVELRDDMVKAGKRVLTAVPDVSIDCMEAVYEKGLCEVAVLSNESGRFELASYRVKNGNIINFWMVLYRDGALTTEVDARYIAQKAVERDYIYDWGIGVYAYKLGTFRPLVSNVFTLETKTYSVANLLRDVKSVVKGYVKSWIGR